MNSLALRIAIARVNATTTWVASVLPVVRGQEAGQPRSNLITPGMP
ncbi:hypothetical protein [Paenarthrobacter nitroguajacolicus]